MKKKILITIITIMLLVLATTLFVACAPKGGDSGNGNLGDDGIDYSLIYGTDGNGSITKLTSYGKTLEELSIPSSIKGEKISKIGESAFRNCSAVKSVSISKEIKEIGKRAFSGCGNLSSITVEAGNDKYVSDGNCVIDKVANCVVVGCKDSVIPSYVTSVGEYAFANNDGLTSIKIPEGVERIYDYAFYECANVTSVEIPSSVTSIGENSFAFCDDISKAVVPTLALEYIHAGNLKEIELNGGDETLQFSFSECVSLEKIKIAYGAKNIGSRAFAYCDSLKYVELSDSVAVIGAHAFDECINLISVKTSSGLTHIGEYAFFKCVKLTDIELPNSLLNIGRCVFSECDSLANIEIPQSVTDIGDFAFYHCVKLKNVVIPIGVENMGSSVFYECFDLSIYCEAEEQPSDWNDNWNNSYRPVEWGYEAK